MARKKTPRKQSSSRVSRIASRALRGENMTQKEIKSLAGSVLAQDETKGQKKRK